MNKIGGDGVLLDRLVHKFGKAEADSPGVTKKEPYEFQLNWRMKDANRFITRTTKEKITWIDVTDMVVLTKMLEAKKKTADTGFDK